MNDLFPLPVSPFEYYYLCDDTPEYPTTFFLELTFTGRLERGPLEGALALVLSRHPLFSARIDLNNGKRPNWLAGEAPQLDWAADDEPMRVPQGLRIDLQTSPGLRVWARAGRQQSRLLLQYHHACADGLAAGRFAEELLLAYHALFDASGPPLPPLDPQKLKWRDEPEGGAPRPSLSEIWNTAAFWMRLTRAPQVVAAPARAATVETSSALDVRELCGLRTAVLPSEELRALRRAAAAAQKATFNDLLLRDLFLTLGAWNAQHGGGRRLGLNVPVRMHEKLDRSMPATNTLGFVFPTRTIRPQEDSNRLLASIQREMEQIKRDRAGRYFLGGLGFACLVPGLVPWILKRQRCFASVVLSNLGRIGVRSPLPREGRKVVVGETVLQRSVGFPPIRPHTRAALAVMEYGGEATIGLQSDRAFFDTSAAEELLGCYVNRLRTSSAYRMSDSSEASPAPVLAPITSAADDA